MSYPDYESIAELDEDTKRTILHSGDEVERVWAAWSLALELGPRIVPDLLESLRNSPSPGTRRHLIVVLAGFGERSILERCALQDPDEWVRSTGARYLIRTSTGRLKRDLLNRMLEDPSPVVRMAVVQEIDQSSLEPDQPDPRTSTDSNG